MKDFFLKVLGSSRSRVVPDEIDRETVVITKPTCLDRGFFSMVTQAISNAYDLRKSYKKFYFDYRGNLLYEDKRFGEDNFLNNYFEQDKTLLTARKNKVIDWAEDWYARRDAWNAMRGSQRDEVNAVLHKHLKIKRSILEKIDHIKQEKFQNRKVLGLHKRGTDHDLHGEKLNLDYYFAAVDAQIDQYDCLYLATDEAETLDRFKAKYKKKIICFDNAYRSEDGKCIHQHNFVDNYKKGEDVLIEAVLLSSVDFLLKTMSNVTLFSILYNKNLPYKRIDTHIEYHR